MPSRRTSPRRLATRPTAPLERSQPAWTDDDDDERGPGALATAAPWLAVLALILAAATIGYVLIRGDGGGAGDLTACRTAAWQAIPDKAKLPTGWTLDSTDLNANGITVSFVGTAADASSNPPVVYASITCYGNAAGTALQANRDAADAARSTIVERTGASDAFDVTNPSTGSTTTVFRVGSLVAQVADSGDATRADLDAISAQVAAAMGDQTASGKSGNGPDAGPGTSDEPQSSDIAGESTAPFAPELEAALPTSIANPTPGAASGSTIALTVDSASASDVFAQANDPGTRALSARIRTFGKTLDDLQYAEAFDESGTVNVAIRGFRLPGVDPAKLHAAIVETWLSSTAAGVKTDQVTIAGKPVTRIDYGDQSALEYVVQVGDVVIVVEADDPAVAKAVIAALK
jgi:hypothetical protein